MDNQHRKISGYRELSQEEIDLMNSIKAHGNVLAELLEEVRSVLRKQHAAAIAQAEESTAELERLAQAEPQRWLSIARTHFQEGFMALTRAVAQPGSAM